MRVIDIINLCRQSLSKQKARTRLTVLGVVIGCCAIVLMMSLGIGSNEQTKVMLSQLGDLRLINVWNFGGGSNNPINKEVLEKMRMLPNVEVVTPKQRMDVPRSIVGGLKGRYKLDYGEIIGVTEDALEKLDYQLKEGSYLKDTGKGIGKKAIPVLVGERFFYEFTDTKRPEGKNRRYFKDPKKNSAMYGDEGGYVIMDERNSGDEEEKPYEEPFLSGVNTKLTFVVSDFEEEGEGKEFRQELEVVGVLKADPNKDYLTLSGIYMSVEDMESIVKAVTPRKKQKDIKINYNEVMVKAKEIKNVKEIQSKIKEMGYEANSMESIRESITKSTRQQQVMLAGLGAISLFVAAIGIMNTMIMSITERTKEIGIMKALGCYVIDIRKIFLVEAGAIGFIGGIIGVIISLLVSLGINIAGILGLISSNNPMGFYEETEKSISIWKKLATLHIDFNQIYQGLTTPGSRTSVIPIWLIVFGLVFSTLIGLISGYHPANKAVKIPALEAIKHE